MFDSIAAPLERIGNIIDRANSPDLVLFPTENGCRYCAAKGACPAVQEREAALVKTDRPKALAPEALLRLYESWQVVAKRGEAVEGAFKQAVGAGLIPGWRMCDASAGRECTDPNELFNRLLPAVWAGRPAPEAIAEFMGYMKVKVSDLETAAAKALRAATMAAGGKMTVAEATERFRALAGDTLRETGRRAWPVKEDAGR
jgi:hypothetical protein